MPQPLVISKVLVGRQPELAALDEAVGAALRGAGTTVLISGEAGIGKSRLVREVEQRFASPDDVVDQRPREVLQGHCLEPDRLLPFGPLLDLLRSRLVGCSSDQIAELLEPDLPHVARLLPELGRTFPVTEQLIQRSPEQEKHQIFQALLGFFGRLASRGPLLVVIEDLHWCDDTSLEFLLHLARRAPSLPLLLLLTYRDDEVGPSLLRVLSTLDRARLASEIALGRLSFAEVEAMLRAIFDQPHPIRADFLQAIDALTDGNPFFIEEVLRSLVASGEIFRTGGRWDRKDLTQMHIPRSVQDAVTRRSATLSQDARTLLQLAAVAGRYFDFTILQALTSLDEPALLALIRELIDAQMVVEESAERFAFRHALTQQAIYAQLLARERRSVHLAIARAMEALHASVPEPRVAELARHFALAEDWAKTLDYARRAGEQAAALYAPREAAEHFTRALEAAAHLEIALPVEVLQARAQAWATLGEFMAAQADYEATLDLARAAGDLTVEWRALLDLGELWAGRDYARAGDSFQQALTLSQTLNAPRALAESLRQLGNWYVNTERIDEAEQCFASALAIFEQAGDRVGIAQSVDMLGTVADIAGDITAMRRRWERAAQLFRELGDRQALSSTLASMFISAGAYVFEPVVVPPLVSGHQAMREADEALVLARETGWRAGEAYALLNLAIHFGAYGEYERALRCATEGFAIAREIEHREWMTHGEWTHGMLMADLCAWSQAGEHFDRARELARESGSMHWLALTLANSAEARAARGDHEAAAAVLADVPADLTMRTLGQRSIWLARARVALGSGDAAGALAIVERLFASATGYTRPRDIPLLALLHGECLTALRRYAEAEEALTALLHVSIERGLRPLRWRSHAALARLYAAAGRATEAQEHGQAASDIVSALAAPLPPDLAEALRSGLGALLPVGHDGAVRAETAALTPRERDVAALLTRGLSNREIADALYIGERTVETHVGNILAKLGFTSRIQIATWALETGSFSGAG